MNHKSKTTLTVLGALSLIAAASTANATVTTYNVTQNYNQVVYNSSHPTWDTVFTGSFSFDSATNTISGLTGKLSQAMLGEPTPGASNWIDLTYQLSSVTDGTDGLIVTVFRNNSVNTFDPSYAGSATPGPAFSGVTFGSNGKMGAVYTYGYPYSLPTPYGAQNAFASIYVPLADPTMALTLPQIDKLAYGDCTAGGLMPTTGTGTKCMAGWVAFDLNGNRIPGGTMQGTLPITQTITAVPEPETYAMFMAGLGLMGFIARRRKANPV